MQSRDALMQALTSLEATLRDRELAYHVVIIGGAALLLSNEGARPTEDVDVVAAGRDAGPLRTHWQLPDDLRAAAEDVADLLGLDHDWLNAGAVAIVGDTLPERYEQRLRHYGFGNLTVSVLARRDLLALKLLASFDEGPTSRHLADLRTMRATPQELQAAFAWAADHRHPDDPLVASIASVLGLEARS
jgi:hypothetical protein